MKAWNEDDSITQLGEFASVCDALYNTHTTSMRKLCQLLQCSRSWANTYIKPYVPHIVLMNGKGKKGGINWQQIASMRNAKVYETDNIYYRDTLYFDDKALWEYIQSHVTNITRQTIQLRESCVLGEENAAEYLKLKKEMLDKKDERIAEITKGGYSIIVYKVLAITHRLADDEIRSIFKKYFAKCHNGEWLEMVDCKKRTDTAAVTIKELPPINTWQAPHDAKEYGDTDEGVYVKFFNEGRVKITLSFGEKGQKVYYAKMPVPEALVKKYENIDALITISMKDAIKYKLV